MLMEYAVHSTKYRVFLLFMGVAVFLSAENLVQNTIFAQMPTPVPVPCNPSNAKNPEFQSLRPYQASPCNASISGASFCGDSITFYDEVEVTDPSVCSTLPGGLMQCTITNTADVNIDLSGANLPIMGNTEEVQNSQTPDDVFDDPKKVNEYVSWYLNGVIGRAEYGDTKNTDSNTVNFSGPLKKLAPQAYQDAKRIEKIESASYSQQESHNQIVVCDNPAEPCYTGNNTEATGQLRLRDWAGVNSGQILINVIVKAWLAGLKLIYPAFADAIDTSVGDHWYLRTPPLPWKDENGQPFATEAEYRKAYSEWQGNICVLIPVINKVICINSIFVPDKYAKLFPYIPLSSTADRVGQAEVSSSVSSTDEIKITNVIPKLTNALLYFSHMQESDSLAAQLQGTFIPKDNDPLAQGSSEPVQVQNSCKVLENRTNKGDNLFAGDITGTIKYTATFSCDFTNCVAVGGSCAPSLSDCGGDLCGGAYSCSPGNYCCMGCPASPTCKKKIPITLAIETQTPLADDVWSRLVSGTSSVVRRIFPKLGEGSLIGEIKDIPATTQVEYSGTANGTGDLNFAHIGGVSEYFLKGIQTILRPKGYGEPITFGATGQISGMCDVNVPDSAVPANYLGQFKANFIDLANRWTWNCQGDSNNLATECYNYVVTEAEKAGVNPGFALTIWLNESDASNYCHGGPTTQDFGINIPSMYQNLTEQLVIFLNMANERLCDGVLGFSEPMHGWLSRFQSSRGVCDPSDSDANAYYNDVRDHSWNAVTGCPYNGRFGITWPTDSSCP
jgi:hypothetical protein